MLRLLFISLIVLLLGSCLGEKQEAEYERTKIELHVHLFDNKQKLSSYVNENFEVVEVTRSGFARWWKDDPKNECHIYVVRGLSREENSYGHELQHCIYGSFHKE